MVIGDQLGLFQYLQSFITPEFVTQASGVLGQTPDQTRSIMNSAIPSFLMGLVYRGSTHDGAQGLMNTIRESGYEQGVPSNLTENLAGAGLDKHLSAGHGLLANVFGSRLSEVIRKLSDATGNETGKTAELLALIAPVGMGALGEIVRKRGLDAGGLSSYLGGQRTGLSAMLPSGIGSIFGGTLETLGEEYGNVRSIRRPESEHRKPLKEPESMVTGPEARKRSNVLPLVILGLLAFLALFWMRNRARHFEERQHAGVASIEREADHKSAKKVVPTN